MKSGIEPHVAGRPWQRSGGGTNLQARVLQVLPWHSGILHALSVVGVRWGWEMVHVPQLDLHKETRSGKHGHLNPTPST